MVGNYYGNYTLDLETSDGLKGSIFAVGGLAWKEKRGKKLEYIIEEEKEKFFEKVFEQLEKDDHKKIIVWVQNLDFDGRFIMDYLDEKEENYNLLETTKILEIKTGKVIFRDSLQFLLQSQEKAEKDYLGRQIKKEIKDWKKVSKEELKERVKTDVEGLYLVLKEYNKLKKERGGVDINSTSTNTINAWKKFLKKYEEKNGKDFRKENAYGEYKSVINEEGKKKYFYDYKNKKMKEMYEWTRKAYYGGRVEVFDTSPAGLKFDEEVFYFDENSEYPAKCAQEVFPDWENFSIYKNVDKEEFKTVKEQKMYIIEATVEENNFIPILPVREDVLLFANGKKRGVWASPEFELFIKEGGEIITIHQIKIFHHSDKKLSFFEEWYKDRLQAEREGKKGEKQVIKIEMNSCTGKAGQNPRKEKWIMCSKEQKEHIEQEEEERVGEYKRIGKKLFKKEYQNKFKAFMIVDLPIFITSYARVDLWQTINKIRTIGFKVYYTDTDSIVTNCNMSIYLPDLCDKKVLGKWKNELEEEEEEKIEEFQALNCKTYYLRTTKRTELKSKGISRNMICNAIGKEFEAEKYSKDVHNYFDSAEKFFKILKEGLQEERFLNYRSSLQRNGSMLSYTILKRTLKKEYDKRKTFTTGETEAWEVEEYQEKAVEEQVTKKITLKQLKEFREYSEFYENYLYIQQEGFDEQEWEKGDWRFIKKMFKKVFQKEITKDYKKIEAITDLYSIEDIDEKIAYLTGWYKNEMSILLEKKELQKKVK